MLHSASVLSFILWSSYLSLGCFPLPLSETSLKSAPSEAGVSANLTKRDPTAGKFFLGYRYAKALAAWEYEHHGTGQLTDFRATEFQLGEGAYIAPKAGIWETGSKEYLCEIWVDPGKIKAAPRASFLQLVPPHFRAKGHRSSQRLIPDELLRERIGFPPVPFQQLTQENMKVMNANIADPKRRMTGIWNDIKNHGQKVEDTILVSGGCGDSAEHCFQMLVPPFYLRPSPIYERPGGKGDLGMYVNCVRKELVHQLKVPVGTRADWSELFEELKRDEAWNGPGCSPSTEHHNELDSGIL